MGAIAEFAAFAIVYTAIERGIFDCAVAGAQAGHDQHWYEQTSYLIGPLPSFPFRNNIINGEKWAGIPEDLQKIIIEEATKSELEQFRLAPIQNFVAVQNNIDAGMELVEFSPELMKRSIDVALIQHVIPGWLQRIGYPREGKEAVALFNNVSYTVGKHINPDGSVTRIAIAEGPYTHNTIERALLR